MAASFFATAWATAVLFSLLSNADWFRELAVSPGSPKALLESALAVSALIVLCRPRSRAALLAMAALQLADVAWMLPFAFNHRLVLASVNAALLVCAVRGRSIECAAPAARAIAVVVYAFAFLAKLNTDFLDPASSCAVAFARHIGPFVDQLPGGAQAVVLGTLLVEAALPVLLVVPRTRKYGVLLGLAFHLALSFDLVNHFVDFSSVMAGLLLLFARIDVDEREGLRMGRRLAIAFAVLIAAGAGVYTVGVGGAWAPLALAVAVQGVWIGWAARLIALVLRSRAEAPARAREILAMRTALVPLVALVALNGFAPYLGLKTHTAWNMYSNLDVQPDRSNHLLVGRSLDVLGLQRDTATLLAVRPGPDALAARVRDRVGSAFDRAQMLALVQWLEPDVRWTRLELERLWGVVPELTVAVRTDGGVESWDAASAAPSPWRALARKLLLHRPTAPGRPPECRW